MRLSRCWRPLDGVSVNLGSGLDYREGWLNVDRYAPRADARWDLWELPWDLQTGSVDWLYANQVMEHVPPRIGSEDGLVLVLREIHRVLKDGGRCFVGVPYAGSVADHENITHYRHFVKSSFDFLDLKQDAGSSLAHHVGVRFRVVGRRVRRTIRLGRLFDSGYHLPRYLRFKPNIGRRTGIDFVLERPAH